jgi:putative transcriptional regulator
MSFMTVSGSDLTTPVLLMAMPQVLDPFFHRSVVLLLHHEDEGSFGFIVNRPTGIKISEILQGMDVGWEGRETEVAYFGGPVQPQLGTVLFAPVLLETGPEDTATQIAPGVALTQHIGDLSRLAEAPPDDFRLLLGYAGWGEGQLDEEMTRHGWFAARGDAGILFDTPTDERWGAAFKAEGIDPRLLASETGAA